MCSRTRRSLTNVVWKYSQSTCLVISSLVGPSPPVVSTISTRAKASSRAWRICSRSSWTEVIWCRLMPASLRRSAIHAELVSTTCPISNSSPMVIISAFICLNWKLLQNYKKISILANFVSFSNKNTLASLPTKIVKNNERILFCLIASLFLILELIRPIKASFIVLLNPILNNLPTADYQQNRLEMIIAFR